MERLNSASIAVNSVSGPVSGAILSVDRDRLIPTDNISRHDRCFQNAHGSLPLARTGKVAWITSASFGLTAVDVSFAFRVPRHHTSVVASAFAAVFAPCFSTRSLPSGDDLEFSLKCPILLFVHVCSGSP